MLTIAENLEIDVGAFVGESVAILGIKGSGKTNTAAVIIEELLAHLPLTIVDREGEYWGLKEKYQIIVAGQGKQVDIPIGVGQAPALAEYSITQGISIILDLSGFDDEDEMEALLVAYFEKLWQVSADLRKPYQIVLEEAHEFIPQTVKSDLKAILTRIALRGRKRGLGLIMSSQRSAKVEKDLLTQAGMLFLHRVVHPVDMKIYQDLIPLKPREVESMVGPLPTGKAVFVHNYTATPAQIRLRHTFHAGATPDLAQRETPALQTIDTAMLDELRKLMTAPPVVDEDKEALIRQVKKLEAELGEKSARLAGQDMQISDLQRQVEMLSRFNVQMQPIETVEVARASVREVNVEFGRRTRQMPMIDDAADMPIFQPALTAPGQGYRSPRSIALSQTNQKKRFGTVVEKVAALPKAHRDIFKLLMDMGGKAFSLDEIAPMLGLSATTLKNAPPLALVEMGLLRREGQRGYYRYASIAQTMLSEHYPDLDASELFEQLLQEISRR